MKGKRHATEQKIRILREAHVGNLYVKRGEKGTSDEFVMGFRVHPHVCNPAGGLHGGMMMTVADLVGGMGAGTLAGLRKFLPTVNMTFDFVAPAKAGRLGRWKARPGARHALAAVQPYLPDSGRGADPARLLGLQDLVGRRPLLPQGQTGARGCQALTRPPCRKSCCSTC
ncbi:MAG: PaaI family thioesterase [Opitutus sp.]|nr:PaaI family thioesterase [Opitutus sp.]